MICKYGIGDACKIKEGCKYCTDKPDEYNLLTLKILSVLIDEKEKSGKQEGELIARKAKKEILDIMEAFKINVARNLIAWDSSKDKNSGLLPEVYYKNLNVYKLLNGKDYNFCEVSKEFSEQKPN